MMILVGTAFCGSLSFSTVLNKNWRNGYRQATPNEEDAELQVIRFLRKMGMAIPINYVT